MDQGGAVVVSQIDGGYEAATKFLDKLEMLSLSANLGDSRTIATHPASTTHSKLTEEEREAVNITPGMVRIAVGLEAIEHIQADIEQALG